MKKPYSIAHEVPSSEQSEQMNQQLRSKVVQPIIKIDHISKTYQTDVVETTALNDISFTINQGEFVAIMGPSGSGKSTLMHIIGALDLPSSGTYLLDGELVSRLTDDQLADIRNRKIGFIFQAFNLLPRTSCLKNVMLPMAYAGIPKAEQAATARRYLELVGLGHRLHHTSNQISGGQQQRVAIARSLVMNPALLLADEPTGNIASAQAEEVMAIFQDLNDLGHTIVMITHEPDIAEHAQRIITIRDGMLESDSSTHQQRRAVRSAKTTEATQEKIDQPVRNRIDVTDAGDSDQAPPFQQITTRRKQETP